MEFAHEYDSEPPPNPQFVFLLVITGDKPRDQFTAQSLERLCDQLFKQNYELTVIDALKNPDVADREKILATPTLIRVSPQPPQRIVGDLCASREVLEKWGLVTMR